MELGRTMSGSDVNCRAFVEDIVKNRRLSNYSKVTKEEIVVHLSKLVTALAEDPASLWSTLGRIAPPRTTADVRLGRGYDGDYTNSPGGGPAQMPSSSSAEEQHATTGEEQPPTTSARPAWRPVEERICISVLERQGPCSDDNCSLEHPDDCRDVACHGRRRPECKGWHLTQHKWSVWSAELGKRRSEHDKKKTEKHRVQEHNELTRLRQEKKDWMAGKSKPHPRHREKKAAAPGAPAASVYNTGRTGLKSASKQQQPGLQQAQPPRQPCHQPLNPPPLHCQQHFPVPPPPGFNAWSTGMPVTAAAQAPFTPAQIKALTDLIRAVVRS